MDYVTHSIGDNAFLLTNDRSIYWEREQILILSDLHLGKSGHFRKHGIAVPQGVFVEDLHRLFAQMQFYKPRLVLVVGDLFHSRANLEHEMFLKWRRDIIHFPFALVKGNHDILDPGWYASAGIDVYEHSFTSGKFSFVHDINDCESEGYCFTGHIHPRISLTGSGRQSVQVPCFYFGKEYAILPAFGKFTGTHPVKASPGDSVYAIADDMVIRVY